MGCVDPWTEPIPSGRLPKFGRPGWSQAEPRGPSMSDQGSQQCFAVMFLLVEQESVPQRKLAVVLFDAYTDLLCSSSTSKARSY